MGLDMYAYSFPTEAVEATSDTDLKVKDGTQPAQEWYWRKFNHLHGWMKDLYHTKGGTEEFNCVPMRLTKADIDALELAIVRKRLAPRHGFFWGSETLYPEDEDSAKDFVRAAKQHLEAGRTIIYDSWW